MMSFTETRDLLRIKQAPIKSLYRADPASALITLRADGTMTPGSVCCRVATADGLITAGLHPATGGDGTLACSGEMLLQALVGCAGVTMSAVACAMGIPLRGGSVRAEGVWDARGTLGAGPEARVGLSAVRLTFEVDADATPEQLRKLLELTERYCVVYQTLKHPPTFASEVRLLRKA